MLGTDRKKQDSPANGHIEDGAGDAVGIFPGPVIGVNVNLSYFIPTHDQGVLKAASNVPVADEQLLDDPEG
jgi:hypothetical protein